MTGNENGCEQWSVDIEVSIPELGDVRATGVDLDVVAVEVVKRVKKWWTAGEVEVVERRLDVSVVFVDRVRIDGERATDEDEQAIITSPAFLSAVRREVERARSARQAA